MLHTISPSYHAVKFVNEALQAPHGDENGAKKVGRVITRSVVNALLLPVALIEGIARFALLTIPMVIIGRVVDNHQTSRVYCTIEKGLIANGVALFNANNAIWGIKQDDLNAELPQYIRDLENPPQALVNDWTPIAGGGESEPLLGSISV